MLEARQYTLHSANQPLTIVEVGGGTGTLAASVLVRWQQRSTTRLSSMTMQQHLLLPHPPSLLHLACNACVCCHPPPGLHC